MTLPDNLLPVLHALGAVLAEKVLRVRLCLLENLDNPEAVEVVDVGAGEEGAHRLVLRHVLHGGADFGADAQRGIVPVPRAQPPAHQPVHQLPHRDVNRNVLIVHSWICKDSFFILTYICFCESA